MRHHTGKVDAVVVGGGIAGLTAAALLAEARLSVTVVERSETLGGRGTTQVKDGYHLNLGPHAWYTGGPGTKILSRLGIRLRGRTPRPSGAFAFYHDRPHTLPIGLISLLTTDLLGVHGKLEAARLLATLPRLDPRSFASTTIGEWLHSRVLDPRARDVVNMFIRVAAYADAPRILSADAALHAFQIALRDNVQYLDGGWQLLVDDLEARARMLGVEILRAAPAAEVLHNGAVSGVRLDGGEIIEARHVVMAVSPAVARRLVPHAPDAVTARWTGLPAKAATLDLGLARLPRPSHTVAFGVDRPLYYSVHSATAALAPRGGALVHVAKYLDPLASEDAVATERELEGFMDRLQPGWRSEVVVRRYLPSMVVSHMIPSVESGGLSGRPAVEVRELPGLFLAGDWVGAEGMLASASVASAARAAALIRSADTGVPSVAVA